jgi:hypothetical protein
MPAGDEQTNDLLRHHTRLVTDDIRQHRELYKRKHCQLISSGMVTLPERRLGSTWL